jgi:hypothetical protein
MFPAVPVLSLPSPVRVRAGVDAVQAQISRWADHGSSAAVAGDEVGRAKDFGVFARHSRGDGYLFGPIDWLCAGCAEPSGSLRGKRMVAYPG